MEIEKAIANVGEYPVFIRGASAEEAVWLLGSHRSTYKFRPNQVHAFPIYKGFAFAGISPIKPIPKNYNLKKLRDDVLLASGICNGYAPSLYNYGDDRHEEEFLDDEKRIGAIIYFSSRIIESAGYRQDRDVLDRLDKLCSVKIPISEDFNPENVCLVEPLGITDYRILISDIPKPKRANQKRIMRPRFNGREEFNSYVDEHLDSITFVEGGFTFPK